MSGVKGKKMPFEFLKRRFCPFIHYNKRALFPDENIRITFMNWVWRLLV